MTVLRTDPVLRFWSYVDQITTPDGCWSWTGGINGRGYGNFKVDGRTVSAHRFALELASGPIPAGLHALHHCDNRRCVRPDHLYAGTDADNAKDRDVRGRTATGLRNGRHTQPDRRPRYNTRPERRARGERSGKSRLREAQVIEARRAVRNHEATYKQLADRFGVSYSAIGMAVRGQTWRHVVFVCLGLLWGNLG